ncbi:MAG TPA: cytochrome c biogenesis protein CcsA, partial [Geobacterales bacterium]|nr:cytochrome c biogenesis protein CcsA [Geobacterales bacterium]
MTNALLFNIATLIYFIAMIAFIGYLAVRQEWLAKVANGITLAGFVIHTAAMGLRWYESYQIGIGRVPLTNLYESAVFFAWSVVLFYLVLVVKYNQPALGAFVVPFAFLTMNWAQLNYWPEPLRRMFGSIVAVLPPGKLQNVVGTMLLGTSDQIEPLLPPLQSNWLTYHVITCFIGYGAFAVACGVSIMYLIRVHQEERGSTDGTSLGPIVRLFPATKVLDDINY